MFNVEPIRGSLKHRVFRAGAWSFVGYGVGQVIRFGSNLVMTRLLVPDAFGVMAIATIILIGLALFSDLGVRANIVQSRRGNDPLYLNTAWVTQILRGLLLWVAALGIAMFFFVADRIGAIPKGSVYGDPRLVNVVLVISLTAVITGFNSTKLLEASRNLALGRVTLLQIASSISALLCMLIWVYFDRSIWALVAGNICSTLTRMILTHVWLPGTPNRWHWDNSAFWEIFHFGKWFFLSSILAFFVGAGDRLFLGGMIDTVTLGVYSVAFTIANSIEQILLTIVSGAVFPALGEVVRERPAGLRRVYGQLNLVVALCAYFCAGTLMTFGQSLIRVLYDSRYAEAGWMVEILAVGLITVPFQVAIYCFIALGRPQLNSTILGVRLASLVVAMPLGFHFFGLAGALWGIVTSQLLTIPIIIWHSARYGFFDLRRELLLLPIVLVGAGAGRALELAMAALLPKLAGL